MLSCRMTSLVLSSLILIGACESTDPRVPDGARDNADGGRGSDGALVPLDARSDGADDADGSVVPDADAGGCIRDPCTPTELRFCADGTDSDCDGLVDCEDPDCAYDRACFHGCAPDEQGLCDNVADDDCDGLVDCGDPDCSACLDTEPPERCANSMDDDCDGFVDCLDEDCAGAALEWCMACHATEFGVCFDLGDNDGDGDPDCVDVDCAADLVCTGGTLRQCSTRP